MDVLNRENFITQRIFVRTPLVITTKSINTCQMLNLCQRHHHSHRQVRTHAHSICLYSVHTCNFISVCYVFTPGCFIITVIVQEFCKCRISDLHRQLKTFIILDLNWTEYKTIYFISSLQIEMWKAVGYIQIYSAVNTYIWWI